MLNYSRSQSFPNFLRKHCTWKWSESQSCFSPNFSSPTFCWKLPICQDFCVKEPLIQTTDQGLIQVWKPVTPNECGINLKKAWACRIFKLYVLLKFSHFLWINTSFCTSSSSSALSWFVNLLFFHHRPSFQSLFNLYLASQNYTHTFIWHCYQYLLHLSHKQTGIHWSLTETRLRTKNS